MLNAGVGVDNTLRGRTATQSRAPAANRKRGLEVQAERLPRAAPFAK